MLQAGPPNNWNTHFPAQRSSGDLFPEKVSSLAGAGDVQNSPKEGVPRETVQARVHNMAGGGGTPWLGWGDTQQLGAI